MHPSTVVRRTDAGSAELAAPAHGLSLTQRRFLTLLDTACSLDELALRHPAEVDKFERDLARLATLGLVACEAPPANEPVEAIAANEPMGKAPAAVRLGMSRPVQRLALIVTAAVALALVWIGWQRSTAPATTVGPAPIAEHVDAPTSPAQQAPIADPQPIATRVLRSDPAERAHDAPRDTRAQPKRVEPRNESVAPSAPPLPVEHRGPRPEDAVDRPAPILAAPPTPAAPLPAAPVAPTTAAPVTPAPVSTVPTPAAATPAAPTRAAPAAPGPANAAKDAAPVQIASAAPPAGLLRPAPPLPALVPIAREAPSFPREAIALGLAKGLVKARLTIDAKGNVESVDIVEASHRTFNRAVRDALARWRFEPGAGGRTTMVDITFKRD